jgi:hypothetical protein
VIQSIPPRQSALLALNDWLLGHGVDAVEAEEDAWLISEFEDAYLFAPAEGRRSNRLYLVRGHAVSAFSPSTTSFDDAYAALDAAN